MRARVCVWGEMGLRAAMRSPACHVREGSVIRRNIRGLTIHSVPHPSEQEPDPSPTSVDALISHIDRQLGQVDVDGTFI